jgi:hypothetical protein
MSPEKARKRFPAAVVTAIRDGQVLGIRAGTAPHRVIGVWAVVVNDRVFVRSWGVKPDGWYRAFVKEPVGHIVPMGRTRAIPVRAVPTRSERTRDAVSRAYAEKYDTPGSLKYVRDLSRPKCRNTTTELVPQ